jgi:hypothetical protein
VGTCGFDAGGVVRRRRWTMWQCSFAILRLLRLVVEVSDVPKFIGLLFVGAGALA